MSSIFAPNPIDFSPILFSIILSNPSNAPPHINKILEVLKEKYESVLALDNVIGIAIATRCDAITDETLDYLTELNKRTNLTIELGLQTIHEKTSNLINRCHTLSQFESMVKKLQERTTGILITII